MESTSTSATNSLDTSLESLEKSVYSIKLGDENYQDSLKLAESYKEAGIKLFMENKFPEAIDRFSDAINLNIETNKNAIYYSNRANCHNKMENFGLALQDSNKSIEIDKDYIKAYFRRASANLILSHFDEAINDLEFVCSKFPNDECALDKLKKARSEKKKKLFMQSITSERTNEE
jgi:serine/threonine-protein phosphatase 5